VSTTSFTALTDSAFDEPSPEPIPLTADAATLIQAVNTLRLDVWRGRQARHTQMNRIHCILMSLEERLQVREVLTNEQLSNLMVSNIAPLDTRIQQVEHAIEGHLGSKGISAQISEVSTAVAALTTMTTSLVSQQATILANLDAQRDAHTTAMAAQSTQNGEITRLRDNVTTLTMKPKAEAKSRLMTKAVDAIIVVVVTLLCNAMLWLLAASGQVKNAYAVTEPAPARPAAPLAPMPAGP
jgi:hypothetical protein